MKKLSRDAFNQRLKQTLFEAKFDHDHQKTKKTHKSVQKDTFKTKAVPAQKWSKPRKMRKHEKFALACVLTYVVYMMQMAQHF